MTILARKKMMYIAIRGQPVFDFFLVCSFVIFPHGRIGSVALFYVGFPALL